VQSAAGPLGTRCTSVRNRSLPSLAHGVRTIIDLRNADERKPNAVPRPEAITTLHLTLDNLDDKAFWEPWINGPQFGTPLYYPAHLRTYPTRSARVVAAVAHAPPGGVLFHCAAGRDRTGMIAILLLSLLGVDEEHIQADYMRSAQDLGALYKSLGQADQTTTMAAFLTERGQTLPEMVAETLRTWDRTTWMRDGELSAEDVSALRDRVLTPAP